MLFRSLIQPTISFFSLNCHPYFFFFFFFDQITSPSWSDRISLCSNPKPPQASISTSSVKHKNSFQSTHKHRPPSQAPRNVLVNLQALTHNHKFTKILSISIGVSVCGCVLFYVDFKVRLLCIVILWRWWWWWLGVLGCGGGSMD